MDKIKSTTVFAFVIRICFDLKNKPNKKTTTTMFETRLVLFIQIIHSKQILRSAIEDCILYLREREVHATAVGNLFD